MRKIGKYIGKMITTLLQGVVALACLFFTVAVITFGIEGYVIRGSVDVQICLGMIIAIAIRICIRIVFPKGFAIHHFFHKEINEEQKSKVDRIEIMSGIVMLFCLLAYIWNFNLIFDLVNRLEENEMIFLSILFFMLALFILPILSVRMFVCKRKQRNKRWFWIYIGIATVLFLGGKFRSVDREDYFIYLLLLVTGLILTPIVQFLYDRRNTRKAVTCQIVLASLLGVGALYLGGIYIASISRPTQDKEGVYLIKTKEGYDWFAGQLENGNTDINIRLIADIVINDTENFKDWENNPPEREMKSLYKYSGIFDGNGYAIIGYYQKDEKQCAMFQYLNDSAVVKNLVIKDAYMKTEEKYEAEEDEAEVYVPVSILTVFNSGTIENCSMENVIIEGKGAAGGICFRNKEGGKIRNCTVTGDIRGGYFAGGICGSNSGVIEGCLNEATVSSEDCAGGICAKLYEGSIITESSNAGKVIAAGSRAVSGGIIGNELASGYIENVKNTGTIISGCLAGGIAGESSGRLINARNQGEVTLVRGEAFNIYEAKAGGISGQNAGEIENCLNTGMIKLPPDIEDGVAGDLTFGISFISDISRGKHKNCYFLEGAAEQTKRQTGVFRLREEQMKQVDDFLTEGYYADDWDTFALLDELPSELNLRNEEYHHLILGPEKDIIYTIEEGDSLARIAEKYYGDELFWTELVEQNSIFRERTPDYLVPGETIRISPLSFYMLKQLTQGGGVIKPYFGGDFKREVEFCVDSPRDWLYETIETDCGILSTFVPRKRKRWDHTEKSNRARSILLAVDTDHCGENTVPKNWKEVKKRIRKRGEYIDEASMRNFRFLKYKLENGDNLYEYSFVCQKENRWVSYTMCYRMTENFAVEVIGIANRDKAEEVSDLTRYMGVDFTEISE